MRMDGGGGYIHVDVFKIPHFFINIYIICSLEDKLELIIAGIGIFSDNTNTLTSWWVKINYDLTVLNGLFV